MAKKKLAAAKDYLIVDCHMHLYAKPEHSAGARALFNPVNPPFHTQTTGLIEDALEVMDRGNIAQAFLLPTMPIMMMRYKRMQSIPPKLSTEERVQAENDIDKFLIDRIKKQNRWSCQVGKENPRFVPFVIVDPIMGAAGMRKEIKDCVKLGAKGLGEIIPDEMGWSVDGLLPADPVLDPMWETAIELNLPIHPHFGPSHSHPLTQRIVLNDEPEYYDAVLAKHKFPKYKFIELHMGFSYVLDPLTYKPSQEAGMAFAKRHPEVLCDISGNIGYNCKMEDFVRVIREVGVERVIWGSDFHWVDPVEELKVILESNLMTEREKRMVLGENAVRLYNLKV